MFKTNLSISSVPSHARHTPRYTLHAARLGAADNIASRNMHKQYKRRGLTAGRFAPIFLLWDVCQTVAAHSHPLMCCALRRCQLQFITALLRRQCAICIILTAPVWLNGLNTSLVSLRTQYSRPDCAIHCAMFSGRSRSPHKRGQGLCDSTNKLCAYLINVLIVCPISNAIMDL